MDEQDYENKEIIEYLLGALPAAKTERFDELSFTDEGFAGALDAAENELLDRYARGELAGDALDKFKSYYLASPLRREKASFAETFQIYGEQEAGKKVKNTISSETKLEMRGGFFSFLDIFKKQNPLRFGFAFAVLLLLIAGGFLFLNNQSNVETAKQNAQSNAQTEQSRQIEEQLFANANKEIATVNSASENAPSIPDGETLKKNSNPQRARSTEPEKTIAPPKSVIAAFVLSPSMRGDGKIENLSIPKQTSDVDMKLELEADDFTFYRVALTDETGSVNLWRSGKVKATGKGIDKFLSVRFPAGLLKSKIYSFVVSGISSEGKTEIIDNYSFRAVIK